MMASAPEPTRPALWHGRPRVKPVLLFRFASGGFFCGRSSGESGHACTGRLEPISTDSSENEARGRGKRGKLRDLLPQRHLRRSLPS